MGSLSGGFKPSGFNIANGVGTPLAGGFGQGGPMGGFSPAVNAGVNPPMLAPNPHMMAQGVPQNSMLALMQMENKQKMQGMQNPAPPPPAPGPSAPPPASQAPFHTANRTDSRAGQTPTMPSRMPPPPAGQAPFHTANRTDSRAGQMPPVPTSARQARAPFNQPGAPMQRPMPRPQPTGGTPPMPPRPPSPTPPMLSGGMASPSPMSPTSGTSPVPNMPPPGPGITPTGNSRINAEFPDLEPIGVGNVNTFRQDPRMMAMGPPYGPQGRSLSAPPSRSVKTQNVGPAPTNPPGTSFGNFPPSPTGSGITPFGAQPATRGVTPMTGIGHQHSPAEKNQADIFTKNIHGVVGEHAGSESGQPTGIQPSGPGHTRGLGDQMPNLENSAGRMGLNAQVGGMFQPNRMPTPAMPQMGGNQVGGMFTPKPGQKVDVNLRSRYEALSPEDRYYMDKLVMSESRNQPLIGQAAVMKSIFNRADGRGKSIKEIAKPRNYEKFNPNKKYSKKSRANVERASYLSPDIGQSAHFANTDIMRARGNPRSFTSWWNNNPSFSKKIYDHTFRTFPGDPNTPDPLYMPFRNPAR